MGRVIGIDPGTTSSLAACWEAGQVKIIANPAGAGGLPGLPSLVAIDQGRRCVGQEAKDCLRRGLQQVAGSARRFIGRDLDDPDVLRALRFFSNARKAPDGEVEMLLGERYFSPMEIMAMLLEQLKKNAEMELGEEVTHAVITVPACFGQRQKNATRQAARLAGLNVLRLIGEPSAAALAFGLAHPQNEPRYVLVFRLGGGTFDVSILLVASGNFEVLQIEGDNFLGGEDVDSFIVERLLRHIQERYGEDFSRNAMVLNRLKDLAERAKIDLSRQEGVRILQPGLAVVQRGGLVDVDYFLSRAELEMLIAAWVQRMIATLHRALDRAELAVDDIHHVLLAGGSTHIPVVRRRLKEIFGSRVVTGVDPQQCAVLGAALQTAFPIEWVCTCCKAVNDGTDENCLACGAPCGDPQNAPLLADDCPHLGEITSRHLGIEIGMDYEGAYNRLEVIVPKGTPYPTHEPYRAELYTTHAAQTIYRLPVYEVETEETERNDWEHVGEVVNEKLPSGTPANTPIVVEMRLDSDGVLAVTSYLNRHGDETCVDHGFDFGGAQAKNRHPTLPRFAVERSREDGVG